MMFNVNLKIIIYLKIELEIALFFDMYHFC